MGYQFLEDLSMKMGAGSYSVNDIRMKSTNVCSRRMGLCNIYKYYPLPSAYNRLAYWALAARCQHICFSFLNRMKLIKEIIYRMFRISFLLWSKSKVKRVWFGREGQTVCWSHVCRPKAAIWVAVNFWQVWDTPLLGRNRVYTTDLFHIIPYQGSVLTENWTATPKFPVNLKVTCELMFSIKIFNITRTYLLYVRNNLYILRLYRCANIRVATYKIYESENAAANFVSLRLSVMVTTWLVISRPVDAFHEGSQRNNLYSASLQ